MFCLIQVFLSEFNGENLMNSHSSAVRAICLLSELFKKLELFIINLILKSQN